MKYVPFLLILLVACAQQAEPMPAPDVKPIRGEPPSGTATTIDGHTIAYKMYKNPGKPGVILLHMLGRTRTDWNSVAEWLQGIGYAVITLDLRGHGQSSGNYQQFTPLDYNAMVNDVLAAKNVLGINRADVSRLSIIGASIGANIALQYAKDDPDVKTAVLLSPGLDYRGVKTSTVTTDIPLLIVASMDDQYSTESSQAIADNNAYTELKLYQNAGHGTNMFQQPDLAPTILDWLKEHT